MIKKTLIGMGLAAALGGVLFGTDAISYVKTTAFKVRTGVKDNVPLEFQVDRLKQEVVDLVPDIHKHMHVIAMEEVEVEDLRTQIATTERNLDQERQEILALRQDLDNSEGQFKVAGRKATPKEVQRSLNRKFERFQDAEAALGARKQMLDAREQSLFAAREKLNTMLGARRDLEVEVQNLEARLKMVRAAQSTSEFQLDDSQLARCKKLVSDVRKRLDAAERTMAYEGKLVDEVRVELVAPGDLGDQIDDYFGQAPASSDELAL